MAQIERHSSCVTALVDRGITQLEDKQFSAAEAGLRRALRFQLESDVYDQADVEKTRKHLLRSMKEQGKLPVITEQPTTQRVQLGEPAKLSVEVTSSDVEHTIGYQWLFGGKPIDGATEATLVIPEVSAAQLGRYHVGLRFGPTDLDLGIESSGAFIVDASNPVAKGGLKYETYLDIEGGAVSDLTASPKFPAQPDEIGSIGDFELPADVGDEYGVRIMGFITPPKNGDYVFYLASDDSSQLFLSTDESPENMKMIASLTGHHRIRRGWQTLQPDNISLPISLVAGRRY